MTRPIPKLLGCFVILIALLLIGAFIHNSTRPAPAPPPLPSPNGYDDFVAAGKMVSDDFSEYGAKSEPELRELLAKNSEAIKLARKGLTRECRVPLVYSATTFLQGVGNLKAVAFVLAAEGRLAELGNRPRDAADSYVTAIRIGLVASRGGLMIHCLVGMGIESIGSRPLEKLVPSLDANECREAAVSIEAAETKREPPETVVENENLWIRRSYGWRDQIVRLLQIRAVQQSRQRFVSKVTNRQIATRMLLLELAARAYELEKGQRPKNAADLVPGFLKGIPQDPVTHTNMVYP